eukprot:SAG22_NODE_1079_length_5672_cov_4.668222_6_plen_339_part_00
MADIADTEPLMLAAPRACARATPRQPTVPSQQPGQIGTDRQAGKQANRKERHCLRYNSSGTARQRQQSDQIGTATARTGLSWVTGPQLPACSCLSARTEPAAEPNDATPPPPSPAPSSAAAAAAAAGFGGVDGIGNGKGGSTSRSMCSCKQVRQPWHGGCQRGGCQARGGRDGCGQKQAARAERCREARLPLPCVSTIFLSKAVPFRAVLHNRSPLSKTQDGGRLEFALFCFQGAGAEELELVARAGGEARVAQGRTCWQSVRTLLSMSSPAAALSSMWSSAQAAGGSAQNGRGRGTAGAGMGQRGTSGGETAQGKGRRGASMKKVAKGSEQTSEHLG